MTTEQIIALMPLFFALIMAWFCGSGDFWRTLRCASFTVISLIIATQHSGWVMRLLASTAPQIDKDLLAGVVTCSMYILSYGLLWLLYHRLWQPEAATRSSKNWWLYGFAGFSVGWFFGAALLTMLVEGGVLRLPRIMPIEGYTVALQSTGQFLIDQARLFVP